MGIDDTKGSVLTELTAPTKSTNLIVVDGVGSTPVTKRASLNNAMKAGVDAVYLGNQSSIPATPASGKVLIYSLGGKLYVKNSSGTVSEISAGVVNPGQTNARLSLDESDPVPTEEITGAYQVYLVPYQGNRIALYDASIAGYVSVAVPAGLHFKSRSYKTGDTVNGSNQISDFGGDWNDVAIGYEISGTNIPPDTLVTNINLTARTVTMDKAATGNGNDITLKCQALANSKWDVYGYLSGGSVRLFLQQWSNPDAFAVTRGYSNGVVHLVGAESYKFLGTIRLGSADYELESSCSFRSIENHTKAAGVWRLDKGPSFASGGVGYLSTAEKQAATWATGGANVRDGVTTTYWSSANMDTTPTIATVDFGAEIVLEKMRFYFHYTDANRRPSNIYIYASATGAWGGEEITVVNGAATGAAGWNEHSFNRTKARYWKVKVYKNYADVCYVFEIDFYRSIAMGFGGIPFGCAVKVYTSSPESGYTLVEAQRQTAESTLLYFADSDVETATKVVITRPDGSTWWQEFDVSPQIGDVLVLTPE